jgi:hypothetical protein
MWIDAAEVGVSDDRLLRLQKFGGDVSIGNTIIGYRLGINADDNTIYDAVHISADSLTGGSGLTVQSDSNSAVPRNMVNLINDNIGAVNTVAFKVKQDANHQAIKIDANGVTTGTVFDIDADSVTTGTVFDIVADGLTTGNGLNIHSNSANDLERSLVLINNTHVDAWQTVSLTLNNEAPWATALQIDKGELLLKSDSGMTLDGSSILIEGGGNFYAEDGAEVRLEGGGHINIYDGGGIYVYDEGNMMLHGGDLSVLGGILSFSDGASSRSVMPRKTTSQRNSYTAINGEFLYDTTMNRVLIYENGGWITIT